MRKNDISYRPLRNLILSEFMPWLLSGRVITMGLFMLATGFLTVTGYTRGLRLNRYEMNYFESISWFLMTGMGSISLSSLAFLVMIAELPMKTNYSGYMLLRTSKTKWAVSLILQCLFTVVVTLIVLLVVVSIFLLPHVSSGNEWNDTLRISSGMPEELAYIPSWIRASLTPIRASILSVLPVFCFWFVMSLTILICSLLRVPAIGLGLYSVILFSGLIFVFENFPGVVSPMTFSTLARITAEYQTDPYSRLSTVLIGYAILITGQIICVFFIVKHTDAANILTSGG